MEIPVRMRDQISQLPKTPGVYFFKSKSGEILYIGKATSLRDRVRSYWAKELTRGPSIQKMVTLIRKIDFKECDSSIEALILEANYIKHYLPAYNIRFRDDKSYYYVKIDNSDGTGFPRLSLVHKNQILFDEKSIRYFGPYTSSKSVRLALKLIRKIFPYRSCTIMLKKPCLQYHIKRCPAPCVGYVDQITYKKNLNKIILILEGKKERLIRQLKREMTLLAKKRQFEDAVLVRNQFVALQHLREAAKISDFDLEVKDQNIIMKNVPHRIEGFDVSNTSGRESVVSMVVFIDAKPAKNFYKRFKIRGVIGPNDYAMLQEAMRRRLGHSHVSTKGEEELINEKTWDLALDESWRLPDLFIIDGGRGQISSIQQVLDALNIKIPIIGIAKGKNRKNEDLFFSEGIDFHDHKIIRAVRDEAHRFAVTYHRVLRGRRLIKSELDDIPGIGKMRKQKLLKTFGSVHEVKEATMEEIATTVGINVAKVIKSYFEKNDQV